MRLFEVRTRKLMESGLSGDYRSVFRGRGVEFDEARPYVEGDDVRSIDWNVTARTGEPHVKKHVEEREQTILFAVDISASVAGAAAKRDLAAEICAVLAVAAATNGDRTGLVLFSDRVERFVPPARGVRHAFAIARHVIGHAPIGRGTDLGVALAFLARVVRRRSVVFLLSDFVAERFERALLVAARRHDVIALTVLDPRERRIPPEGLVTVEDAETGEQIVVDVGDGNVRGALEVRIEERQRARDRLLSRAGVDATTLVAGEPYETSLHRLFSSRALRTR